MTVLCRRCRKKIPLQGGVVTKYICIDCAPNTVKPGLWFCWNITEIYERTNHYSVYVGSFENRVNAEEACSYHNLPEGKKRWRNCAAQESVEIDSTWLEGKVEDGLCYAEEYGACYDYTQEELHALEVETKKRLETRDTISFPTMMVTSIDIGVDEVSKIRDLLRDFVEKTRLG